MTETAIAQAFMQRVTETTLTGSPPIILPRQKANSTTPRIEVSIGPTAPDLVTLAGESDVDLMFQITVVISPSGKGGASLWGVPDAIIDELVDRFKVGTAVSTAKVVTRPAVAPHFQDGSEYRVPITVRLEAFL